MNFKYKNVLITGGTGFFGKNILFNFVKNILLTFVKYTIKSQIILNLAFLYLKFVIFIYDKVDSKW